MGPRRYSIAFSARIALISPPKPPVRGASYTTTARPVFLTEARIFGSSSGTRVRRSMTSASTPFSAAFAAASRHTCAMYPYAISETSLPGLRTAASPIGTRTSPSGTSSRDDRYSFFGSRNMTGSGSRIDAVSRPFASFGVEGSLGATEDASVPADVLSQDDDAVVPSHFLPEGIVDRLHHRHRGHRHDLVA